MPGAPINDRTLVGSSDSSTSGSSTASTNTTPIIPGKFVMTDGWYVAIACLSGFILADTRAGPLVAGILTVALIYQLSLLMGFDPAKVSS